MSIQEDYQNERSTDVENQPGTLRQGMLTATFPDRESAERAFSAIENRGYDKKDVNVVMSDKTRDKYFANAHHSELGNKAMEGVGAGSAIGGAVGAIAGAIAAIGTSLIIPGLGLVIAGPIAAAFAGAGAGGFAGGLVGALIGAGMPEEHARRYEERLNKGDIVLAVYPRNQDDADYIERVWRTNSGEINHH